MFSGTDIIATPSSSIQQDLIAARTALAHAGDVNRRTILHRASLLAGAASHTLRRIQIRLLHLLGISCRVKDFCRPESRSPSEKSDTTPHKRCNRSPSPRAGSGRDRRMLFPRRIGFARAAHIDRPAFLFRRDLPDRARGADLRTQHAAGLAITNARNQNRRPKAFQARLTERRLQRVVRDIPSCTRHNECSAPGRTLHRRIPEDAASAHPARRQNPECCASEERPPRRRPVRSGVCAVAGWLPTVCCAGKSLNCNACSGHSPTQFRHR